MKANAKEILRWTAIAIFGGFGIWALVSGGYPVITHIKGDWLDALFALAFVALFATPFLVVAYVCLRRQYRELFTVLGVVGAIVVFGVLVALPHRLHILDFFVRHGEDLPWVAGLGLPVSLIFLVTPFYAAAWVLRVCCRLAQRPNKRSSEPPPANAAGSR